MVVINRFFIVVVIFSFFALGCGVELSELTPGAVKPCRPDAQDLTDADAIMTTYMQSSALLPSGRAYCGSCHLTTSGQSASASFGILSGTDTASKTSNWCSVYEKVEDLRSDFLITTHPGDKYTASEIQTLVNWANTLE